MGDQLSMLVSLMEAYFQPVKLGQVDKAHSPNKLSSGIIIKVKYEENSCGWIIELTLYKGKILKVLPILDLINHFRLN